MPAASSINSLHHSPDRILNFIELAAKSRTGRQFKDNLPQKWAPTFAYFGITWMAFKQSYFLDYKVRSTKNIVEA